MCSYLPKDKQFLVTRNVPCRKRARGLKTSLTGNLPALALHLAVFLTHRPPAERTVEDDADGGWTETLTDAPSSSGGGSACAADDAVDAAAIGIAAASVSDEVDVDDIPDADDDSAAVSVCSTRVQHVAMCVQL